MQRAVDVVGVGLNATDTVIPVGEYPARGSKVEFRGGNALAGGQVATTVVACAQWGLQARYVGKLGDDDAARLHRQAFAEAGVAAEIVSVPGGVSAQSLIIVDAAGERTVLCRKDERMVLQPGDLRREWVQGARVLHVDGHDTAAATLAAEWARTEGVLVSADLDDLYPGVEKLLRQVDYLIVNHDFAQRLMGISDLRTALRAMHNQYGCKLSGATLGEEGVVAWDGKEFHTMAAYRVAVKDSTGAGDVFRAGFIYGLVRGWDLDRQLDFACAAAALNCTRVGARGGIASVEEIERMMKAGDRHTLAVTVGG